MKRSVFILILLLIIRFCLAQEKQLVGTIQSHGIPVFLSTHKTTSLVFPAPILSVDRGCREILTAKAKGVENVLLLKAATQGFEPSNLTVITGEGQLYCFEVTYASDPTTVPLSVMPPFTNATLTAATESHTYKQTSAINEVLRQPNKKGPVKRRYLLKLQVQGVFIKDQWLLVKFRVRNHSFLDYNLEALQFFIRDRKRMKSTAHQERELKPLEVQAGKDY